jgi:hypothetical protein
MSRHQLFIAVLYSFIFSTFLWGCSNHPSEKRAKADLQKWLDYRWPNEVMIVEYGIAGVSMTDKEYSLKYRAKARFLRDTQGCAESCCGNVGIDKLFDGHFHWESKAVPDPCIIRKGDMFIIEGDKIYNKTESGWISEVSSF